MEWNKNVAYRHRVAIFSDSRFFKNDISNLVLSSTIWFFNWLILAVSSSNDGRVTVSGIVTIDGKIVIVSVAIVSEVLHAGQVLGPHAAEGTCLKNKND